VITPWGAQKQPRADQQNQRQRDFGDHQRGAQALASQASGIGAAAFLQQFVAVEA
jgi:hypothetical protein